MDPAKELQLLRELEELLEGVEEFTGLSYGKEDISVDTDRQSPARARVIIAELLAARSA
jgi:hypothetical protein